MLKKIFTKTRIKILLVVLVSFFMVKTAAPQIFLANTPKINPSFIARLKNAPTELAQLPANLFSEIANLNPFLKKENDMFANVKSVTPPPNVAFSKKENDMFANVKSVTPPPNIIFKQATKGVYAGEDPKTGQKYIKIEAGTKYRIVGTVTINGKEYPKIEFIE